MIEVREVLRRWQAGQKLRQIARETGVDRKTVRRYITWAEGCEVRLDTPLTDEVVHLVAQGVQARPDAPPSEPREQLVPHRYGSSRQWRCRRRASGRTAATST